MNFWGSETQPAGSSKPASTVLGMPVAEGGGFYMQLNKDIGTLRQQVDKKLRDMMVAGQSDLEVLNTALKDLQAGETIGDKSSEHQSRLKYGDEIPGADSNVTERAANLSRRRKKQKGSEVQLIGIVRNNDSAVVAEDDEEDEVETREENAREPYNRNSIMDTMSESSHGSAERQDNLPDKVVSAREATETTSEREGVYILDDESGQESNSRTVDLISLDDYESTGQYVQQRVALDEVDSHGSKSDDSSSTDSGAVSGLVSEGISTRATRGAPKSSTREKPGSNGSQLKNAVSKNNARSLEITTTASSDQKEGSGLGSEVEEKKRIPKEPTPRMTTLQGDRPWLFEVPEKEEEKSTGSETSSLRKRLDPEGQESGSTASTEGAHIGVSETKAIDPNEHNQRIGDLLSLANQWSHESSSKEPPAKSPRRSPAVLLDDPKPDKEKVPDARETDKDEEKQTERIESEETKEEQPGIEVTQEKEEPQEEKANDEEETSQTKEPVQPDEYKEEGKEKKDKEEDKEKDHVEETRDRDSWEPPATLPTPVLRPSPESPRRIRRKSARKDADFNHTVEGESLALSGKEKDFPRSSTIDQGSQTTDELGPVPKIHSMNSETAASPKVAVSLSQSDLDREPKRPSSRTRQRKKEWTENPTSGETLRQSTASRRSPALSRKERRQTPSKSRADPRNDQPPVQELVFDADEDSEATDDLDMDGASHHRERMRRKRENRNRSTKSKSDASRAARNRDADQNALAVYEGKAPTKYEFVLPPDVVLPQQSGKLAASAAAPKDPYSSTERVRVKKPREHIGYENQLTVYRDDKKKTQGRKSSRQERQGSSTQLVSIGKPSTNSEGTPSTRAIDGQQMVLLQQVQNKLITDPYGDEGRYTGVMVSGAPHGQGNMNYNDGRVYSGEWRQGRWHGHGHAIFANKDSYVGQYSTDQRHGHGRYEWCDGRVYDGGFEADHREGHGTYRWPDGAVYTGEFHKGLRHGKGRYIFSDGSVYSGEWQNGKYHGQGECIWADGRRYRGQWVKGQAQGFGVEHRPDGTIRHEGEWKKDRPVRKTRET